MRKRKTSGVEMQGRHAGDKPDLVGFDSRPTPPLFLISRTPAFILWGGCLSTMLGMLYLMDGATLPGYGLIVIGALFVSAAHEAS